MFKIHRREILPLVGSIVICQMAGVMGSLFTRPALSTWYASLEKPRLTPPDWVFAPVWISLYVWMGIAAFLVWRKGLERSEVQVALSFFALQLVLNALWPYFFFGLKSPLAGLIEISFLGVFLILTLHYFFKVSRAAGFLLVPYFLWMTFATGLNLAIWYLNR